MWTSVEGSAARVRRSERISGVGQREVGMRLELPESAVVVEEDRPRACPGEAPRELLLELLVEERRRLPASVAPRVAGEACEEAVGPAAAVERLDALRHRLQAPPPLAWAEPERRTELVDDAVHVPRVHEQRSREHLCRARELGEEQRAAPAAGRPGLGLAEDVLVRDEVHTVPQRRHHHHVRPAIERDEPRLRDVAVQVLDGRVARLPEATVDARDQELDLVPLRPVLRALESGRDEHLQHRRRAGESRVALEEALVREQLLRDALRVVEPLDSEHQPAARVLLLELGVEPRRLGVRERRAEPLDVDADGIDADPDTARGDLERVGTRIEPEHAETRRPKVSRVVPDLEAHVVRAEDAAQQALALREKPVHLGRRERRVQEESDRQVGRPPPQHRRDEHEVEVVDPDARVWPAALEDGVREPLVDLDVVLPGLRRDPEPVGEVVEQRPERVVADAAVEVLFLFGREVDRDEVVALQALRHRGLERLGDDGARPADPDGLAAHRAQRGRQAADRLRDLEVVVPDRHADGQTVACDDQIRVSLASGQCASLESAVPLRVYNLRSPATAPP